MTPVPLYAPRRLDVTTAERTLPTWEAGFPRPLVDLSRLVRFDPFGLLLLVLLGQRCREAGGRLRVLLPENARTRDLLVGSGLFRYLEGACWTDKPLPDGVAVEPGLATARVREEGDVRPIADGIGERLETRFPFGEKANRLLVGALIELLQNIPHHAAPPGTEGDPFGLACLEEDRDHLHLAIADKGIGLAASLGLNLRFRGLDTAHALEAVLVDGASRFDAPGRGGALRRIREAVVASAGRFYFRSAGGAFLQEDVEWSVGEVIPFPGVQISIRLPRTLFERGAEADDG
jgi:anti-anti-sigma regulatory factor